MTDWYGMKCIDIAGTVTVGNEPAPRDAWLREYDPEAAEGRGFVTWTYDPREAMLFPTAVAALIEYRKVSTTRPTRDDGLPNRPLTAFTVSVEKVPL